VNYIKIYPRKNADDATKLKLTNNKAYPHRIWPFPTVFLCHSVNHWSVLSNYGKNDFC